MSKPKVGDIAICKYGIIGLITHKTTRCGYGPLARPIWNGVTLEATGNPGKESFRFAGSKWQTSHPMVIGNMDDIIKKLKKKAKQEA